MTAGIEAALAALSRDPATPGHLGPDAAIVVFDATVERILHASPRAAAFAAGVTGPDGLVRVADPAVRDRLRALAGAGDPSGPARLQRVRFGSEETEPATLLCRGMVLAGDAALAALILDPMVAGDEPAAAGALPSGAGPLLDRIRRQGARRFIWSLDADGRFATVSAALVEVVGRDHADIVGRRWDEIAGPHLVDPGGAVAAGLDGRAPWSDRTVLWRITDTNFVVPVDLGAMPILDAQGRFEGFRGYGLCRTVDAVLDPDLAVPAQMQAQARDAMPAEAARPETLEAQRAETAEGEAAAFASLQTRIGGQLGSARPVALRPVRDDDATPPPERRPILSLSERGALREIAEALGATLESDEPRAPGPLSSADIVSIATARSRDPDMTRVLDRLPVGILVTRGETPLYANRFVLDLLGFRDRAELAAAGGLGRLFAGRMPPGRRRGDDAGGALLLTARTGRNVPVEIQLAPVEWDDGPASLLAIRGLPEESDGPSAASLKTELAVSQARRSEAEAILDLVPVAAAVLDDAGRILSLSGGAERLFGYVENEVAGDSYAVLFAPESHRAMADLLAGAARDGIGHAGRDLLGRTRTGATVALGATVERLRGDDGHFLLVAQDLTALRQGERELSDARDAADVMGGRQSAFLARVNHEIRTPLNAILGFTEVMLEERFGPIENERYRGYLKDIHASGRHVVSLVNDLLDIAKIEAGRADLVFTSLPVAEIAADSAAVLRGLAAEGRVVLRTAFPATLSRVVADERSLRQILLNLVSNAIRFTRPGGQVIVSAGATDDGGVALSVRDTGIGMSAADIRTALEPFRQVRAEPSSGGSGLGLPLAKALALANGAAFDLTSEPGRGTLVRLTFPQTRVLGET